MQFLKNLFGKKNLVTLVDENDWLMKDLFKRFHYETLDAVDLNKYNIHLFEVKTEKDVVKILILLGRPGILIGKGGRNIDAIKEYIERKSKLKINIELKEFDVWKTNF